MAPSKLRTKTLSALRKAFSAMMTPEWDLALEGRTEEEVTEAARTLLAVQRARLRLGNETLADIRDALKANEPELRAGIDALDGALANPSASPAIAPRTPSASWKQPPRSYQPSPASSTSWSSPTAALRVLLTPNP